MKRLTVYTEKGPALSLDGPYRNEQEAKTALMERYRQAVAKLAEYENIDLSPERLAGMKIFYERVSALHDCNDCGKKADCPCLPDWGGYTRINCPLWAQGD